MKPQEKWRKKNPKAYWAHGATRSALKRGLIQKEPCQNCGERESEAHHPDYERPLLVWWLCRACHKAHHRALKNGA